MNLGEMSRGAMLFYGGIAGMGMIALLGLVAGLLGSRRKKRLMEDLNQVYRISASS